MADLFLPLMLLGAACARSLPTVVIDAGTLVGTTTSFPSATATVNQFLGVPFAASPTRFGLAATPTPWTEPLAVAVRKPACIQQFNYPLASRKFARAIYNEPAPGESEDCLYLNIFAPSTQPPEGGFTVMFWLYGGSLDFGNAGQPIYDGSRLAAYENVILVSANYRMNIFGYPSSPELPLLGQNLGFFDMRLSLQWVQDNIAAFGGNPTKVTMFGNSAGAKAIDSLMVSYPKDPPFRAAILQSGQGTIRSAPGRNFSTKAWRNVTSTLNCTKGEDLACLRKVPATALKFVLEYNSLSFHPVVDNVTWFSDPYVRRLNGNVPNIPLLTGTNNDDGSILVAHRTNLTDFLLSKFPESPTYRKLLGEAYAVNTTISKGTLYNGTVSIGAIYTDYGSQCVQAMYANQTLNAGAPTWRYYFNATFPNIQVYPRLGSYHGEEIYLAFTTFSQHDNVTTQEQGLSHTMRRAWPNFAKDPTGAGPGWNRLGSTAADVALLGANGGTGVTMMPQGDLDDRCYLYASIFDSFLAGQM
ncbi:Acetylcholinesterase [Lachnellula suecica]|uniref:Acetylcholinesterase n=1 Tax=Lachnellula suecica TaxID=602035 RepID=A0A8T9CEU7_9HELO|nr:Acetylcholinesterase [Lachnellula suecica]